MIYEIPPTSPQTAAPLFAGATFDRAYLDAIFDGRQAGRLFVDDPTAPTGALLARTYDYFFAGEAAPSLRRFVADAPEEVGIFAELYGYVPIGASWERALLADHGGRLEVIGRRAFRFDPRHRDLIAGWRVGLPDGIAVVPLDAALAERADRDLHEHIGLLWSGYERFAAGGFGFCALAGEVPVSVAYASAVSSREANIGLGTDPAYRRRGLAFAVSAACVERGLDLGLSVTWDCDAVNPPSAALALKLGFREEAPFVELAFPGRAKPPLSTGLWTPATEPAGTVVWRRRPEP